MADTEARVGLVIVSHSAAIAEGVVALAREMAAEAVRLVAAGGMPDGSFGTDAARVAEAIGEADTGAGVVVLADLGSAEMSAQLALDMLDPELAEHVRLSRGPLVEGAVKAAAQANMGANLERVLEAADGAIDQVTALTGDDVRQIELVARNLHGLHARPAAMFIQTAGRFESDIHLENLADCSPPVDAKSIAAVLASGVDAGDRIRLSARGDDADEALDTLRQLVESGFGEEMVEADDAKRPRRAPRREPASIQPRPSSTPGALVGVPGAPGAAIGPIWRYEPHPAAKGVVRGDGPAIRPAAEEAAAQLRALADRIRADGRVDEAGIFEAQAAMCLDPQFLSMAEAQAAAGLAPDLAVETAAESLAAKLADLPNELQAARAADDRDVGARIARVLRGESIRLPEVPSIAVAADLPPSVLEGVPASLLLGLAIEAGSATSHAVILARSRSIPAVVAIPELLEKTRDAATLAVDGTTGEAVPDPDQAASADFHRRAAVLAERRSNAASLRGLPLQTADGRRIRLLANIGGPGDAARALELGAEGVGLFRTEFLFMKRQTAPTEDEQVEAYRTVFQTFGPDRPVVVRLADIGGDKAIPYLNLPDEDNPFLGVRAIRLVGHSPDLLAAQLRAIWRAAGLAGVEPHVMAPMIATEEDVETLLDLRDRAREDVDRTGAPLPERMVTGIMVEVPSAAFMADRLARKLDFFSIGTNDLTQYALAADRSNPALARLQDALHPAVLGLIRLIVAGARDARIPVAVCGELAGDPLGAMVLVGLGVDELSADPGSFDDVRLALVGVGSTKLEDLAERALAAPDAAAVRAMARELLEA